MMTHNEKNKKIKNYIPNILTSVAICVILFIVATSVIKLNK